MCKTDPGLVDMALGKQTRPSVQPVRKAEWEIIQYSVIGAVLMVFKEN
jgi:hypothetical protein